MMIGWWMKMRMKDKVNFMLFGLEHDFFGYGTIVTKLKSGKYKCIVDGETFRFTAHELAEQYDALDPDTAYEILSLMPE